MTLFISISGHPQSQISNTSTNKPLFPSVRNIQGLQTSAFNCSPHAGSPVHCQGLGPAQSLLTTSRMHLEAQNSLTPPSHLPVMGTAPIIPGEELLLIWGCCAFHKKGHPHQIGRGTQNCEKVKCFLWQQERHPSRQESSPVPAPAHMAALIAVTAMREPGCNEYPPVR